MMTFLFDIDGTLLRTGGAGLHAMQVAMRDLFGIESLAKVEVRGRTDRGILRDLFAAHQIDDSPSNLDDFQRAYLAHLPLSLQHRSGYLLPGVQATLARLSQSSHCALGLLTGNSRRAAEIKLAHFAVDHLFAFGGFGDHSICRNEVAHQALRSAEQHLAGQLDKDHVWVIGDTPLDVQCGRAINARTVGVLTGGFDRDAMQAARPDYLLDDLQEFPELIGVG